MNQPELFDLEQIQPDYSLTEPLIWIERISFWESLGAADHIREIRFRKGLNIIATEIATEADTEPVGHDVGKTLLMRLIRYCLGDDHYADEETRALIGEELINGYVLAHFVVDKKSWYVARPLGIGSTRGDSWCLRTNDIQRIKQPDGTSPYSAFVEELKRVTQSCYADIGLPGADDRLAQWQDVLGWLSRDQECLNRHRAEWRVAEAQSGPRVLKSTDAYLVMRMALDILGDDEIQALADHDQLLQKFRRNERMYESQRLSLDGARQSLIETCDAQDFSLINPAEGAMFGEAVINHATEKIKSLEGLKAELVKKFDLSLLQKKSTALTSQRIALAVKIEDLQPQKELLEKKIMEQEQQEDDAYLANLSKPDFDCEFYPNQETAKERGCPGFNKDVLKDHPDDPNIQRQRWISTSREKLQQIAEMLERLNDEKSGLESELAVVDQEINAKRDAFSDQKDGITKRIAHWELIKEQGRAYGKHSSQVMTLSLSLTDREQKTDVSLKKVAKARKESAQKIALLSQCYQAVIQQIVSSEAQASIRVDMTGIHPVVSKKSAGGTTLKSCAKVLAFDFGCLAASLCGLGHLPRLWMHDSPRSADTEDQLYHAEMLVSHWLESFYENSSIPFQQIWTTTSAPPQKLDNDTYVRDRLSARTPDGKLLKRNL